MGESILNTIKKMLGIESDYDAFDTDIIVNINSALLTLTQLGIGPSDGFIITDKSSVWSDLIGDTKTLVAVQNFIYLKVRTLFDPPSSSFVLDAMNKQIEELTWRLNVQNELNNDAKEANDG